MLSVGHKARLGRSLHSFSVTRKEYGEKVLYFLYKTQGIKGKHSFNLIRKM